MRLKFASPDLRASGKFTRIKNFNFAEKHGRIVRLERFFDCMKTWQKQS